MIIPENIHTSNFIWTQQVKLRNFYVHTYMRVTTMIEKRIHEFEIDIRAL